MLFDHLRLTLTSITTPQIHLQIFVNSLERLKYMLLTSRLRGPKLYGPGRLDKASRPLGRGIRQKAPRRHGWDICLVFLIISYWLKRLSMETVNMFLNLVLFLAGILQLCYTTEPSFCRDCEWDHLPERWTGLWAAVHVHADSVRCGKYIKWAYTNYSAYFLQLLADWVQKVDGEEEGENTSFCSQGSPNSWQLKWRERLSSVRIQSESISSRVWDSVNNNNGFWTGWMDLLTPFFIITLN
jgi:hypothetical protein